MIKSRLILFFLITISSMLNAQVSDNYKLISHRAFVKLFPSDNKIFIIDTIGFKVSSPITENISLKLNPIFKVQKVLYKNDELKFSQKNELVNIIFSTKKDFELIIHYEGRILRRTEFSEINEKSATLYEYEIFPLGTKSYEYLKFYIQVPKKWEVIAIGNRIDIIEKNDSLIYIYRNDSLVQTFGWICGGEFTSKESQVGEILISTHLSKDHSDYAPKILEQSRKVLLLFSERFSPYRFNKLSIVEIDNWVADGSVLAAAYPSVILVKKAAFQNEDPYNNVNTILPHEIAHQWWNLTVFTAEQDIALLSEGLCEFSSVLYGEWSSEYLARDSLKHHPLLRPLLMRASKGRDLPLKQKADLRSMPTHYLKGAYVHNMLRLIIGDSIYENILAEFAKEYSAKVSTSEDFQKVAERLSGEKLDWFFKQWTEQTGIPRVKIYGVKNFRRDNKWITQGRVRLVGYEKKYTTPIEVAIETEEGMTKQLLWLGYKNEVYKNEIAFEVMTDSKPIRVLLDPDGDILKFQKLPPKLSDLRDPADGVMIIGTGAGEEKYRQLIKLAKRDSAEMDKAGWWIRIISDTTATLANLQDDRVFIYGGVSENKIAGAVANKFPIQVVDKKVAIDGEFYSDSLSIIQIIDNPFRDQGLMCWIIPLTSDSSPYLIPHDASYAVVDKREVIKKGVWEVKDEDLTVEIK